MAYYAELKRRSWYCINGFNMVIWYSNKLRTEWWNSLSDCERERIEKEEAARDERERRAAYRSLMNLVSATAMMANKSIFCRPDFYDKYHGVYNVDGTPNTRMLHEILG